MSTREKDVGVSNRGNFAAQMEVMSEVMAGGTAEGAVLRQEADGARRLSSQRSRLPNDMNAATRNALVSAGVKLLGIDPNDKLWQSVVLPDGWRIAQTDHPMWTDVLDARGRKRATIFYKAAFYDRSANITAVSRFEVCRVYSEDQSPASRQRMQYEVCDRGVRVFMPEPTVIAARYGGMDFWTEEDAAHGAQQAACEAWLVASGYPDWQNRAAYWDEPDANEGAAQPKEGSIA